jgi:carbonic anhydrase/acetyltransferase-like protein (isoleucine patch superfamily)
VAIYRLGEKIPQIDPSAYVHEMATVIGAVSLGPRASIWPGAVVRADNEPIVIGAETNIQDGCVLHVDPGLPMHIGAGVSIGHQCMLHGCTVGDGSLVGIQAVVLNGARIGRQSLLGACALLTEGKELPDGHMAVGTPARVLRALGPEDIERLLANAASYVRRAALFQAQLQRLA